MSAVKYNGNYITPGPLASVTRNLVTNKNNDKLASNYSIVLNGTIVATSGNDGMSYIVESIKNIKSIFSEQGKVLELISPDNNSEILSFICQVDSINFSEGTWYNRCDYSISLKSNSELEDSYDNNVSEASENWDFSEGIDGIYTISHSLSAVGIQTSGYMPIDNAKKWCRDNKLSISSDGVLTYSGSKYNPQTSGLINSNLSTSGYWNYASVERIGSSDGSWQLQESLIWSSGSRRSREEYTISVSIENESSFDNGSIQIQGTVFGFANNNRDGQTKLNNAKYDFDSYIKPSFYTRVSDYAPSGYSVSPVNISSSKTYDPINGSLNYSYVFPTNYGSLVSNAFNEVIDINDVGQNDVTAEIVIPGRIIGPIVQNIGTRSLASRTVSYSAQFPASGNALSISNLRNRYLSKPNATDINPIFDALSPNGAYYYVTSNTESWNPKTFIFNKTMTWNIVNVSGYIGNIGSGLAVHQ